MKLKNFKFIYCEPNMELLKILSSICTIFLWKGYLSDRKIYIIKKCPTINEDMETEN